MVHAGEYVLTRDEARGAGGGINVSVNVTNDATEAKIEQAIALARQRTLHDYRHSKSTRDSIGYGLRGSLHT